SAAAERAARTRGARRIRDAVGVVRPALLAMRADLTSELGARALTARTVVADLRRRGAGHPLPAVLVDAAVGIRAWRARAVVVGRAGVRRVIGAAPRIRAR